MRTWAKLAAFAVTLAVVFAVASAIGAAVGPIDLGGDDHEQVDSHHSDTDVEERPSATTIPPVEQSIEVDEPATASHDDGVHDATSTSDVAAEGSG